LVQSPPVTDAVEYRLSPSATVRLAGAALVALGLLTLIGTLLVALADLPSAPFLVVLAVGVAGVLGLGWYLRSRAWFLRCTDQGYRVRFVRGAGVTEERWSAVEDAVTTTLRGVACVVLRLRDGRTTTIPVGLLAGDREQFVRELQARLQRGHGLRPWRPPGGPDDRGRRQSL
jgi:hypothetical protein